MLNPDLIRNFLICPACKSAVLEVNNTVLCRNGQCRRQYPIRDEIPVMIIDESTVVNVPDFEKLITT